MLPHKYRTKDQLVSVPDLQVRLLYHCPFVSGNLEQNRKRTAHLAVVVVDGRVLCRGRGGSVVAAIHAWDRHLHIRRSFNWEPQQQDFLPLVIATANQGLHITADTASYVRRQGKHRRTMLHAV